MASTSRPLLPRVADGSFDDRLFYRLNVIHLILPGAASEDVRGRWIPDRKR
jgi:DNA-binding NtrC family response regulator